MNESNANASPTRDPDLLKVGDALRRSARKAQEIALQTGTPCWVREDGRLVNIGAPLPEAPPKAD